ncbi:MAG TPA: hypothetical protein DCG39_04175, partial [Opitutae bacterium]|nr:hypothetical protein [Opitutae bacterium]
MRPFFALFAFLALLCLVAHAELRMPKVFGNGMVLQKDKPVKLWGWARADQKVLARIGDRSAQ